MGDGDSSRDVVLRDKRGELSRAGHQEKEYDSEEEVCIEYDIKGRPIPGDPRSRRQEPQASRVHEKPPLVYGTNATVNSYQGGQHNDTYIYPDFPQYPPQGSKPGDSVRRRPLSSRTPDTRSSDYPKSTAQASREVPIHRKAMGLDEYPRVDISTHNTGSSNPLSKATGNSYIYANPNQPVPKHPQPRRNTERGTRSSSEQRSSNPSYDGYSISDHAEQRMKRSSSRMRGLNEPSKKREDTPIDPKTYIPPQSRDHYDDEDWDSASTLRPPSPQEPYGARKGSRPPCESDSSRTQPLENHDTHVLINGGWILKENFEEGTRECIADRITLWNILDDPKILKKKYRLKGFLTRYPVPHPCGDGSHHPGEPHRHYYEDGYERPRDGNCIPGKCFRFPHEQGRMIIHRHYADPGRMMEFDRCLEGFCFPFLNGMPHREDVETWHTCYCGCGRRIWARGCMDSF